MCSSDLKLIAAAITHHMSLHTIAHEQVTHLWLQVHLLGIRILSYRHTFLHSSFFTLQLSCFTVLYCLLQLLILVMDKQVTVGIDLNDKTGIRINQGDSQKWKENTKREWDKYTFGCYGCWVMDDDGNLDYVPEEEYTEELWNEQKKNGERNRASFSMHK